MKVESNAVIIESISSHIKKQGGKKSTWYVGITSDINQRLHGDHKVPKKDHWFAYREANSADDARLIEKAFLKWGCDGGAGGGDDTSKYVYAYLKSSVTEP